MFSLLQCMRHTLKITVANPEVCSRLRYHSISHVHKNQEIGSRINLKGWVRAVRKMKGNNFVDVSDGSSMQSLQVVVPKGISPVDLTYGSSVEVEGILDKYGNGQLEVKAESITVLGPCVVSDGYPFQPRKSHDSDYVREYLHLRNRTKSFSSLLRLRSHLTRHIHEYFYSQGFLHIHTPVLTSNDCEGAGEVFTVVPEKEIKPDHEHHMTEQSPSQPPSNKVEVPSKDFFKGKTYLSVSGQLHLEAMARSLSKVYSLNPVFRAENSKSRLHLSEFYMIEAEQAFLSDIHDLLTTIEKLVKSIVVQMMDEHGEELAVYRKLINSEDSAQNVESLRNNEFIRMSYSAAVTILTRNGFQVSPESGLSKQHELFLVKYTNNIPIFIINWPRNIKPFYMKRTPDNPDQVFAVDLLCPSVGELCGGGLREDNLQVLQDTLCHHNLQEKLEWYLELRKYGNVPTGGFGIGLERFIQLVCGTENIRDTIPYPRYPHHCKM